MNRYLKFFSIAALFGLLSSGCYPDGPDYTEDLDVVYTTFDDDYDFQSQSTYSRPDKIVVDVKMTNNGDTIYEYMKDIYAQPILQKIDENMANYGWTLVNVNDNPDVLLEPAGISSTTYFYSYWYDWWYGGWGWYYPPYYTISSYTTGSMIIVIADPNIDSPINNSPAAWIAAANGLLTDSGNVGRALDGIDQAFRQSPYLKTN